MEPFFYNGYFKTSGDGRRKRVLLVVIGDGMKKKKGFETTKVKKGNSLARISTTVNNCNL